MVIGPGGVQESDLLVTSMITDRIGRLEVLLPINHNYDKNLLKELDIGCTVLLKKTTTTTKVNSAKCKTTARACDAFCPLTQI